jgi:hypothetical protein
MKQFLIAIALLFCSSIAFGQAGTAPGRVTGNHGIHGTFILYAGISVSCNQSYSPLCPQTSGSFTGPNQVAAGIMNFSSTHDASGGSSGTGGGSGTLYVTCNGGSPLGVAEVTLPSGVPSYSTPACSGVINLNQIQFYAVIAGGGAPGYSENFNSPTQIIVTF